MDRYVIDIETLAIPPSEDIINRQLKKLEKKYKTEDTIEKHLEKFKDDFKFSDLRGSQICCIGIARIEDGKKVVNCTAQSAVFTETLANFLDDWFEEWGSHQMQQVGFNNFGFDWPRIALMYQSLNRKFPVPMTRFGLIDLQREGLGKCDRYAFSLASLAELLNIKTTWEHDGSEVQALWDADRYQDIETYCMEDVRVTGEIFLKQSLTYEF